VPPDEAAAQISPIPLLIVHGDKDLYFPVEHAQRLYDAARDPRELWLVPGFGHAESGCHPPLVDRIGRWVATAAGAEIAQARAAMAGEAAGSAAGTAGGAMPEQPAGDGEDAPAREAAEAAGAAAAVDIGPAEAIRTEALEAGTAGTVTAGTPSDGCPGARP
jgi:hypothetical protein